MSDGKLVISKGIHGVNKLYVSRLPIQSLGTVVFFPGDRIEQYGLDADIYSLQEPGTIVSILSEKFPGFDVVVVSPARVEAGFVAYEHFLNKLTLTGEPLGYYGRSFKASEQLQSLLSNANILENRSLLGNNSTPWPPMYIIGFSKGGVVLNQLISEIAATMQIMQHSSDCAGSVGNTTMPSILHSIEQIHYLDCGLNSRGAYMTDPQDIELLGTWKRMHQNFKIVLHGTPRQWNDPRRPFIHEERDMMLKLCRQNDVDVEIRRYFDGERPSLQMHLKILENFCAQETKAS